MRILYTFSILLYGALLGVVALFHTKAKKIVRGRKSLFPPVQNKGDAFHCWIHCASLGEFEQGRPVIEQLIQQHPKVKIFLSFYSPSGLEVRKNYEYADAVFYLPLDTRGNAELLIKHLQPDIAIFVKYEFWLNHLWALQKNQIPTYLISGIFRPNQVFFKPWGGLFRQALRGLEKIYVQDFDSLELLKSQNIKQAIKTGDTRFDRVMQLSEQPAAYPDIVTFVEGFDTLVVGSSWKEDVLLLTSFLTEKEDTLKCIIAPHEIKESSFSLIENAFPGECIRFSHLKHSKTSEVKKKRVLIIDNIGHLSRIYRLGTYAYVGGAFGAGLHNVLEASVYGLPVFFGNKNYRKFKEANDLITRGCAFPVGNHQEMSEKFEKIRDKDMYSEIQNHIKEFFQEQTGATTIIVNEITEKMKDR